MNFFLFNCFLCFRTRRTIKENYRETEKAVLDSILGKGYDKRIRPSGQNITGRYIGTTKSMLVYLWIHVIEHNAIKKNRKFAKS